MARWHLQHSNAFVHIPICLRLPLFQLLGMRRQLHSDVMWCGVCFVLSCHRIVFYVARNKTKARLVFDTYTYTYTHKTHRKTQTRQPNHSRTATRAHAAGRMCAENMQHTFHTVRMCLWCPSCCAPHRTDAIVDILPVGLYIFFAPASYLAARILA